MNAFMVRWLKLSLVAIVGCGFLAMVIYALVNSDEIRSTQIEPPLITPPAEALKRRPDQPGGMQLPNRDKLVFDLLDSDGTPITPTIGIEQTGMVSEAASVEPADGMVVVDGTATAAPVAPVATSAPEPAAKVAAPAVAKVEEPAPAKEVEKPVAVNGGWGVQLAAVGDKAGGEKAAAKMMESYPALQKLTPHVVATPDGKHYRVQFAGAKTRNEAAAICAKLAGKQACFPVSIP